MKAIGLALFVLALAVSIAGYWPGLDVNRLNYDVDVFGLRLNVMQSFLIAHLYAQTCVFAGLVSAASYAVYRLVVRKPRI